jgi:hypothetical protein
MSLTTLGTNKMGEDIDSFPFMQPLNKIKIMKKKNDRLSQALSFGRNCMPVPEHGRHLR